MTDKRKKATKEDGKAIDATARALVDAIQSNHPMVSLISLYKDAPVAIQRYLEQKVAELLAISMPKLALLMEFGVTIDRSGDAYESITSTYESSLEIMPPELRKKVSRTVEDVGLTLSQELDAGIKRILLEETTVNHEAYLDILSSHAHIIRSLEGLTELPSEEQLLEANEALGDAAKAVGFSRDNDLTEILH
jgi:hypothetical protein